MTEAFLVGQVRTLIAQMLFTKHASFISTSLQSLRNRDFIGVQGVFMISFNYGEKYGGVLTDITPLSQTAHRWNELKLGIPI
jgi:hypothetical protein